MNAKQAREAMSGIIRKIRTQHWYGLVIRALKDNGVSGEIEEPQRGKHPIMILAKDGRQKRMAVPSTERTRGDHKYLVRQIERFSEGR